MTRYDALYNELRRRVQRDREQAELRRRYAIHEAGHAVAAVHLGGQLLFATTNRRLCDAADAAGAAGLPPDHISEGLTFSYTKGRRGMAVLVAGMLAEEEFGYPDPWTFCTGDAEALRSRALRKGMSEQQALDLATAMARPVIAQHRAAIGAVADVLMSRALVKGDEVRQIVEGRMVA